MNNETSYPPRCCEQVGRLWIEDFEHLIEDQELVRMYKDKVTEYLTLVMFRRYCAHGECKRFLPVETYEEQVQMPEVADITVATCRACEKVTCIGCATALTDTTQIHDCQPPTVPKNENYIVENCRVKACCFCGAATFLMDGCNHITCTKCDNEWCFDCLLPWRGDVGHDLCRQYGDPPFDEEGYAKDDRGLHRDTGLDRQCFNAVGVDVRGFNRQGERELGFAYASEERFVNGEAHRPQGFQDLQDEDFEVAAVLEFIRDMEQNGAVLPDDVHLGQAIEDRFGQIEQAGRGGHRGGHRGGRGGHRAGHQGRQLHHDNVDVHFDHDGAFDDDFAENDGVGGEWPREEGDIDGDIDHDIHDDVEDEMHNGRPIFDDEDEDESVAIDLDTTAVDVADFLDGLPQLFDEDPVEGAYEEHNLGEEDSSYLDADGAADNHLHY